MSAGQHVAFLIGRVMLGGMYLYSGITNVSENPQVQFVGVGAQSGKVLQGVLHRRLHCRGDGQRPGVPPVLNRFPW
jgi:hypothetical protein